MSELFSLEEAQAKDRADPLAAYREQFLFPQYGREHNVYFTGHSLGLQPKRVADAVAHELERWSTLAVEGHFEGEQPWVDYHESVADSMGRIVGAQAGETVCMQTLTANLHLLFVSFFRPTPTRFKIISEGSMFPSDRYLLETQLRFHGLDPETALIELEPRPGERTLRDEDILAAIEECGESLALAFFGGVNYLSGQLFDIAAITDAAHRVGAIAGFDLAHAAGNVELALHDWDVDFAAWCTYKYLNSGPGGVGALFVHGRHATDFDLPRFGGWWGHDKARRFLMEPGFQPMAGAEGWQLSNSPILALAALRASLDLFDSAGMANLRRKSERLTADLARWVDALAQAFPDAGIRCITPMQPAARGAQLSVEIRGRSRMFFDDLIASGLHCDFREPNMIRFAPVPLYNNFEDVFTFGSGLHALLQSTRD